MQGPTLRSVFAIFLLLGAAIIPFAVWPSTLPETPDEGSLDERDEKVAKAENRKDDLKSAAQASVRFEKPDKRGRESLKEVEKTFELRSISDPLIRAEVRRHELDRLDRQIRNRRKTTRRIESSPNYGSLFLREHVAKLFERVAMAEACRDLVATNRFYVLGSSSVPSTIPNGHIIRGRSIRLTDGRKVYSYYILTRKDNPRYYDTRDHTKRVRRNKLEAKVDEFNALEYSDRKRRIEVRDEANLKLITLSASEYRDWLSKQDRSKWPPSGRVIWASYTVEYPRWR